MSVSLMQLWLPILLGGFFAWLASSIIHMVLKYHNHDYKELANEDEVMAAIRNSSPPPALYTMPYCIDMNQMGEESMQKKFSDGPVAMLSVFPNGMPPMGKLLTQQILFFIIGCILLAYVSCLALPAGADYMQVFRFVAAAGFFGWGWGLIPFSIWYGHPWMNTARFLLDALIYALVVAGTFAWLWPDLA